MENKVKVGGVIYDIEVVEDLEGSDGDWGCIKYKKAKIQLDSGMNIQIHNQTYIHELTHAILIEAGYSDHDEDMANRIGLVIYQVLKENDFSFLRKEV